MLLQRYLHSKSRRRGQVVLLVAIGLVALIGALAFAFDAGVLLQQHRRVQVTAEAAAMAGATDLFANYRTGLGVDVSGTAKASALLTAKANGFDNDDPNVTVTINMPPASGPYTGEDGYIEVIVESRLDRGFSAIFGSSQLPVQGRAVARGIYPEVTDAILVLDLFADSAFSASGSGTVNVVGAPIHVNSNHPQAAVSSGGGWVQADPTNIVGGYTVNGSSGGGFAGTVNTGVRATPDPLRHLPPPDPSSLTVQSTTNLQLAGAQTYTLSPGVYQGGITITGQANVVMEPGIYYIEGGGFTFGGQGNLFGEGVMIYNAPTSNSENQGISISGAAGGSVTLSPPIGGTYHGITLFQDRTSTIDMNIEGNGNFDITGVFYAANALLKVKGNGDSAVGSQYISRFLDLGGNGGYDVIYRPDLAPALRLLNLVE
jgi:hypothetical protein